MEHRKAPTPSVTTIDSSNNNNAHHHHHNRSKKRTAKRQQLASASSLTSKNQHAPSVIITDCSTNQDKIYAREQQGHIPMKTPLAWTKKWTKWFSSCGSERVSHTETSPTTVSLTGKRDRTKSENDVSKRGSVEQDEKKKLSTTNSSFAIGQNSNENSVKTTSHQHHHQSNDKVNNQNSVLYRNNSRRYSNSFFTSARYGGNRTSITSIPTTTTANVSQRQPHLTRSVDRLHKKSSRRELRYEEHDDYIPPPPPPPLYSIQCHPTIDHYAKSLNQSTYFSSPHRRSQIEAYQLSSTNNRSVLPRPYSSNIPLSHSTTLTNPQTMSKSKSDNNNHTYGKLSECHSALTPLENSSIKAPRRIESTYSQFPTLLSQQEPVYANTQSLYDNILYPQSPSKVLNKNEREKKSCASQTQLTWTMATFSSFVDLENQSVVIPQPDPSTLYSIVQHYHTQPPPSASPETIEQMKRMSPGLQYIDDPSHYQRPHSPVSSNLIMVEKRDGSFQTLLSIGPRQDIEANKQLFIHDSTPSPISTGSSTTPGQHQPHHHHHHHHHRKHKSRNNISTRDVGLQVSIQTVKKITFSSQKSDESSLATTTTSSPATIKNSRELKTVETNTEPLATKRDTGTSYEPNLNLITSSSQTLDSPTTSSSSNQQTKAAQTPTKTLRDQSIETNNRGLFVCDLSSLLKNGTDDLSSSTSSSLTTKRKS